MEDQKYRLPERKIGRNEPCYCGSRRKYKKCCLEKDLEKHKADEKDLRKRVEYISTISDGILKRPIGRKLLSIISLMDPEFRNKEIEQMAKENPKETEMLFRITVEKKPTVDNILQYGYILSDIDKPKKAIEQFKKAISLDKTNLNAHYALAEEYNKINELDLAEKNYKHILNAGKSDKETLWKYFNVLIKQKKFDLIEQESKEILKKDMNNIIVAYYLLETAASKNDEDKAKSAILNFFSVKVEDPDEKKWFDSVVNEAKNKLNLNIKNNDIFPSKEGLLETFNEEDIDRSLEEYEELFSLFPNINFINFLLGILHEIKLDFTKCIFYYNRALETTRSLMNTAPTFILKNSIEEIEKALNMAISKQKNINL